jgi:hypothetical protein
MKKKTKRIVAPATIIYKKSTFDTNKNNPFHACIIFH